MKVMFLACPSVCSCVPACMYCTSMPTEPLQPTCRRILAFKHLFKGEAQWAPKIYHWLIFHMSHDGISICGQ